MNTRTLAAAHQLQKRPVEKLAYTPEEAALATGYGVSTIRLKIALGEIIARKDGEKTVIRRVDLEAFLDALPRAPAPKLKVEG